MSEVAVGGRGKAKAEVIEASRMVDELVNPLSPGAHLRGSSQGQERTIRAKLCI